MPVSAIPKPKGCQSIPPDELVHLLRRGAQLGIDPRRILLALGFRPADDEAARR
jgi:hypothetical protein